MLGQTFFSARGAYSWGGEGGVPVSLPPGFPSPVAAYYGALLFLVFATLAMTWIARSDTGLIFRAIAGNERTARASGVDVARGKRNAFLAAGLFAGAAGIGFAALVGRATTVDLSLELSFQAAAVAAIGGRGTVAGPVVAAVVLHAALQGAGFSPTTRVLLYGSALLLVLRFFPAGAAGALRPVPRPASTAGRG